ncbi:MAG: hypothetical protein LIO75_00205 [Lachnospiraceae bacterium]|nr:hypothetical protein [Lachnospiraceae bacterium]
MRRKRSLALLLCMALPLGLCACQSDAGETVSSNEAADSETQAYIEETLNLANNENQEWTYTSSADAWVLSSVSAVAYPEIEDEQGVSVCVPGAYVTGIDTDGDGTADVTAEDASDAVNGSLVIDYDAEITSTNGQVYTAATAPVILNTGAAGYSEQSNSNASTSYAAEGYINVSCGNRGKQSTVTDDDGNTVYTGDAPSCLVDQKNAARYVKYNILLGNLPGSVDYFVSTGGSGGGAHATMFAATSNNSDFYDYEIEAGAVGVYYTEDGGYTTTVTIDGTDYEISDGAWGCIAYSAITSLYEGDMALAFEYYLDTDYSFSTDFQAQLAEYLSESYMEYINDQNLTVDESAVGFDINEDGDTDDTVELTIEYDPDAYAETNGYYGTYLNFYLAEFTQNLQWYLDSLDYADGWTWFDADGNALSDDEVAAMTTADKATAFIEGRYTKSSSGSDGMPGGDMGGDMDGGMPGGNMDGGMPDGDIDTSDLPGGDIDTSDLPGGDIDTSDLPGGDMDLSDTDTSELPDMSEMARTDGSADDIEIDEDMMVDADDTGRGGPGRGNDTDDTDNADADSGDLPDTDTETEVGTPDAGTTQSATGSTDSANYDSYEDMVAEYEEDIYEILAGDEYGNNIVSLYNPLNYIGSGDTEDPVWTRIVMGASEGDMPMFTSLNLQIAWLNAGADAVIEWQWDGGHVPSEVLGESLALYVDEMYGEYVDGAVSVEKASAEAQTENGTSESASGTDLSSWVNYDDISSVSFTLADAVSYRTAGASKAMPGFDVIDYGQEDYVFGSSEKDARHWNTYLLDIFQTYADVLEPLFNQTD